MCDHRGISSLVKRYKLNWEYNTDPDENDNVKVRDITDAFCDDGHIFTVAYVQTTDPEIDQLQNTFLKNVGRQSHVQ